MNESEAAAYRLKSSDTTPLPNLDLQKKMRFSENVIQGFLFFCGALSILTTIGIIYVLLREAIPFFLQPQVTLVEFFTGTVWQPQINKFGILPLLNATIMSTAIAMMVALPLGLCVAIYLSEYATPRARNSIKPILEILAGIPTWCMGSLP